MTDNSATQKVNWYDVKDPHPAALPNLQALVDYMFEHRHTNALTPVTAYRLSKDLNKHPKQLYGLIENRPGFVKVYKDGKPQGYYYDFELFGSIYPARYTEHRGKSALLIKDMTDYTVEANKQIDKKFAQAVEEVKAAKREYIPDLPEIIVPGNGKRVKAIVEFPVVEDLKGATFIAFDQLMDRNRSDRLREESGVMLVRILLTSQLPKDNNGQVT